MNGHILGKDEKYVTTTVVDSDSTGLDTVLANVDVISVPPVTDTGQAALAVRVISSLAGGGGATTVTGTVTATPQPAPNSSLANVAASATSVTVLAANSSRLGAVLFNDSSATAYLKFGSSASNSSFTYRMDPFSTLEVSGDAIYTGILTAAWSSATGTMRVTEIT